MGNPDNSKPSSTGPTKYTQMPPLNNTTEPWSVGLCDCFSDCGTYCKSVWCPCVTFGQVSHIVDGGSSSCGKNGVLYVMMTLLTGLGCAYSCIYRSKMREMFKLPGGSGHDCLIHCFCESCALTQMYRELQNRGLEVSLGWEENVKRQARGVADIAMAPPTREAGMNRR